MSTTTLTDSEKRERLKELMGDFDTAMLVTRSKDGGLRSRPLSIAHNADDNRNLYFSTAADSPKVEELEADPRAHVCMQENRRFVSVAGVARVVKDRVLIDKLWSEAWRIWFPKGKNDPSLCIVIVEPTEAAYWNASGIEGVTYLFEMAKAYVTGTKAGSDADERHVARLKLLFGVCEIARRVTPQQPTPAATVRGCCRRGERVRHRLSNNCGNECN